MPRSTGHLPLPAPPDDDWRELAVAADICGVTLETILLAGEAGLVRLRRLDQAAWVCLDEESTFVLRQVHELRDVRGLGWDGIRALLAMQARIDRLEREVRRLRDRLP